MSASANRALRRPASTLARSRPARSQYPSDSGSMGNPTKRGRTARGSPGSLSSSDSTTGGSTACLCASARPTASTSTPAAPERYAMNELVSMAIRSDPHAALSGPARIGSCREGREAARTLRSLPLAPGPAGWWPSLLRRSVLGPGGEDPRRHGR